MKTLVELPPWIDLEHEIVFPTWGRYEDRRVFIETFTYVSEGETALVVELGGRLVALPPQRVTFSNPEYQRAHEAIAVRRQEMLLEIDPLSIDLSLETSAAVAVFGAHIDDAVGQEGFTPDVARLMELVQALSRWTAADSEDSRRALIERILAALGDAGEFSELDGKLLAAALQTTVPAWLKTNPARRRRWNDIVSQIIDADPRALLFDDNHDLSLHVIKVGGLEGVAWDDRRHHYPDSAWPWVREAFRARSDAEKVAALQMLPIAAIEEGLALALACGIPEKVLIRAAKTNFPPFRKAAKKALGEDRLEADASRSEGEAPTVEELAAAVKLDYTRERWTKWALSVGARFLDTPELTPLLTKLYAWARIDNRLVPLLVALVDDLPTDEIAMYGSWKLLEVAPFLVKEGEFEAALRVYAGIVERHAADADRDDRAIEAVAESIRLGVSVQELELVEELLYPVVNRHPGSWIAGQIEMRIDAGWEALSS